MFRYLSILCVLSLVASGCITEGEDAAAPADEPGAFRYADDRITIESIDEAAKQWVPTLAEPPQLTLGEYWKVAVNGGFDGESFEAFVVVAGQEEEHWLVGMPTHDFDNELMVLHIPGFGQVRKATLGFEAHDQWFDPVKFPLEVGNTWTTGFMTNGTYNAEVVAVDGLTATIQMTGNFPTTIVYDASIRGVRSMDFAGYGSYEVLEHGFDWHEAYPNLEGTVTVPHMADLVLCDGRLAGAAVVQDCGIGGVDAPMDDVGVDTTYDRVSFSLIIVNDALNAQNNFNLPTALPNGYYNVVAIAPDGTRYEETLTPAETGVHTKITSYKQDKPGGTWNIQAIAGGPGLAFAEGIGYHVYDVEIATGRILPSIGEHQHGDHDGH